MVGILSMNTIHIEKLDLNLLRVFETVDALRNVTQAARALGQTQSSVSHALNRLRDFCGDPLFVRTRKGMEPTPFAASLIAPVREALRVLKETLESPRGFDARMSQRTFNIALTDIGEALYLPTLMNRLGQVAPSLRIVVHPVAGEPLHQEMESGRIDLAIGHLPGLKSGFYQQGLYSDRYVCVARKEHPRIRGRMTLKRFLAESHLLVHPPGTGTSAVELALNRLGHSRRISLTVPHFHAAKAILASTDLLSVVASRSLEMGGADDGFQILRVPFPVTRIAIRHFWHARFHHDAGNRWLRGLVAELFAARGGAEG